MLWKPDTCDCRLEYNGSNDPANFVRAIKTCVMHTDPKNEALDDNRKKNKILDDIYKNYPEFTKTINTDDGVQTVLDESKVSWSYDKTDRTLEITISDKTKISKMQTDLDKLFTKVKIK